MLNMQEIKREPIIATLKTIFEFTIEKMELAVALPFFTSNSKLSMILTTDEINIINEIFLCNIEICPKYLPQLASINENLTDSCVEKIQYNMHKFDHAIHKALKILDRILKQSRINILATSKYISMTSAVFLYHIRYFLEHVLHRMHLTAEQWRRRELYYRKLWCCQKKSMGDIASFTTQLEKQQINHRETLEDIIQYYGRNIIIINNIVKRCNEYITNLNMKYEKKQIIVYKEWEHEQNEIQIALRNIITDLESLKDINMKSERIIYKQKLITESKLLTTIVKYDTEMSNKYTILKELDEIYKYHNLKRLELEKEMERQEEIYFDFVKRKKERETDDYESLNLSEDHSARIIQRWWRKIFWDRKEKEQ